MAKTKTLLQIKSSVFTEGQYENSSDITSSVLNDYINKAIVRRNEILAQSGAEFLTAVGAPFTVVAGTQSYALPTDFEHLRKVEISTDNGSNWYRLRSVELSDTEKHQSPVARRYRYRLQGGTLPLALHPTPSGSTDQIRVWYIPYATELVSDSDTITINVDAEYELIVALALRKCRVREDLDTSAVDATIADCTRRLASMADNRDDGEPFYLSDRRHSDGWTDEW